MADSEDKKPEKKEGGEGSLNIRIRDQTGEETSSRSRRRRSSTRFQRVLDAQGRRGDVAALPLRRLARPRRPDARRHRHGGRRPARPHARAAGGLLSAYLHHQARLSPRRVEPPDVRADGARHGALERPCAATRRRTSDGTQSPCAASAARVARRHGLQARAEDERALCGDRAASMAWRRWRAHPDAVAATVTKGRNGHRAHTRGSARAGPSR